ncbi:MAG: hypothetical protein EOP45_07545 [Sphingobacteriaceae bacterium]|nr:MAG: hypothetical protein EOP45_07545 [Sphingobacteriaceae bacterium]
MQTIEDEDVIKYLLETFLNQIEDIDRKFSYWAPEVIERKYGTSVYNAFMVAIAVFRQNTGKMNIPEKYQVMLAKAVADQ